MMSATSAALDEARALEQKSANTKRAYVDAYVDRVTGDDGAGLVPVARVSSGSEEHRSLPAPPLRVTVDTGENSEFSAELVGGFDSAYGDELPRWVPVQHLKRLHSARDDGVGRRSTEYDDGVDRRSTKMKSLPRMVSFGQTYDATFRLDDAGIDKDGLETLRGRVCADPMEAYRALADAYEERRLAGRTHDEAMASLRDEARLPAGWLGARPYVAKFAPGPKLRLAWVVAWVLLLAEFAFLLAVWITMDARETFGVALRAMAVAFFVEPVGGLLLTALAMAALHLAISVMLARARRARLRASSSKHLADAQEARRLEKTTASLRQTLKNLDLHLPAADNRRGEAAEASASASASAAAAAAAAAATAEAPMPIVEIAVEPPRDARAESRERSAPPTPPGLRRKRSERGVPDMRV